MLLAKRAEGRGIKEEKKQPQNRWKIFFQLSSISLLTSRHAFVSPFSTLYSADSLFVLFCMCHEKMYKFSCTLTRKRKFFNITAHPVSFVLARGSTFTAVCFKKVVRLPAILKGLLTTDRPFSINKERPMGTVESATGQKKKDILKQIIQWCRLTSERKNERIPDNPFAWRVAPVRSFIRSFVACFFETTNFQKVSNPGSSPLQLTADSKWRGSVTRCDVPEAIERIAKREQNRERERDDRRNSSARGEGWASRINVTSDRAPRWLVGCKG